MYESVRDERGMLVDSMAELASTPFGCRVAIYGDPDLTMSIARFCGELGMEPVDVTEPVNKSEVPPDGF
jgi:nitrogenase molybdenum-iron protein beta chain